MHCIVCSVCIDSGDVDLVNSLLFDAEATRGVLANWLKENYDGTMNDAASKK